MKQDHHNLTAGYVCEPSATILNLAPIILAPLAALTVIAFVQWLKPRSGAE